MDARIITSLTEHISGHVYTGSNARNTIRTGLWNGFEEVIAPVVVECSDSDDIQTAVRIAAEYNLPVSVLGGGHDWYRRSVSQSGVTLDLRQMRQVAVSSDRASLIADGGAVVKNAVDALPQNYALVTGVHTQVGLAGLALGGGYGKLNSRFGLVTDNLKSATIVLADGSLVTVSEDENAELFWALRGAGKNFGVLCSAEFIIHKLSPVLTATIFIAPPDARNGLCNLQDILDSADDRLSVFSTFSSLPGKGPGLILEPMWSGDEATGERYLQQLSSLAGATIIKKTWSEYRETYDSTSDCASWPKGPGYRMDAFNLDQLNVDIAEAIVECCRTMPSQQSCVMLHDFRGKAARVATGHCAFAQRDDHFNMQIVAGWQTSAQKVLADQWMSRIQHIMPSLSEGMSYPAVVGSEGQERARNFYGPSLDKLLRLKKQFDPDNRFRPPYGLF
nr:FAD-binding oxidoreductase [uncultured Enterobacter sp.]